MIRGYEDIKGLTKRAFMKYNNFILLIENIHYKENPILSSKLEAELHLSGPEIRALRALAWRKGDKVLSYGKGYFWGRT